MRPWPGTRAQAMEQPLGLWRRRLLAALTYGCKQRARRVEHAAAAQVASFKGNNSMSGNNKSGNTNHPPSFTAEQQAAFAKLSLPSDAEFTSVTNNVVSAAIDALRWDGTLPTATNSSSRSTSPNGPTNHLYAPPPLQHLQQRQQRPHNKKEESMTTMIDNVVQGEQRLARLKEDLEVLHQHQMLLETTGTGSNSRVAMMMKPQHHQLQHIDLAGR